MQQIHLNLSETSYAGACDSDDSAVILGDGFHDWVVDSLGWSHGEQICLWPVVVALPQSSMDTDLFHQNHLLWWSTGTIDHSDP